MKLTIKIPFDLIEYRKFIKQFNFLLYHRVRDGIAKNLSWCKQVFQVRRFHPTFRLLRREEEMKRRIEKFIAAIVFQEEGGEGGRVIKMRGNSIPVRKKCFDANVWAYSPFIESGFGYCFAFPFALINSSVSRFTVRRIEHCFFWEEVMEDSCCKKLIFSWELGRCKIFKSKD